MRRPGRTARRRKDVSSRAYCATTGSTLLWEPVNPQRRRPSGDRRGAAPDSFGTRGRDRHVECLQVACPSGAPNPSPRRRDDGSRDPLCADGDRGDPRYSCLGKKRAAGFGSGRRAKKMRDLQSNRGCNPTLNDVSTLTILHHCVRSAANPSSAFLPALDP
jgi:hypothetical protein